MLAHLVCPGRHTITSLITTCGKQHQDWSADYDLYSHQRVHPEVLFEKVRREVESFNEPGSPLVVAIDDTILRKTGKHIPTAAYRKDPLGPPFNINLVWAQRMLQMSAAVQGPSGAVRMVPIAFDDASTPRKPRKNAPDEQWEVYRELMKQTNLNHRALQAVCKLQKNRAASGRKSRLLHLLVDGSFTNRHILRNLSPETTLIGRIRKDAHLNLLPDAPAGRGRKRIYGDQAPTPEELRKDPRVPWKTIRVKIAGKKRGLRVKALRPVRWRKAGERDLMLVVIAPTPYLKRIGGKRLYRQPAYLICTDPSLPLEKLVQEYIWRWDIEVNHRDEKTLLGVGQAQVRNEHSVESVPASAVAAYAMLHIAAMKAYGWNGISGTTLPAKWRDPRKKHRASTLDLINELRRELWSPAIRARHLTDFMAPPTPQPKSHKNDPRLCNALFRWTA